MFSVRIHGRSGQGVVTAAELLSVAAFHEGKHAQAFPSFGSQRTGYELINSGGSLADLGLADWAAHRRAWRTRCVPATELALKHLRPGKRFRIDLDFCKGCGICAQECPCGAIEMVPEKG